MSGELRFRDLGPLEIERAGEVRLVGAARLESALALLLIHSDHTVGADRLAEAIWGDDGVERSAATLDSHVFRLRRLLEPARAPGAAPSVLLRDPSGFRLVIDTDRIDSVRYAALAAEAGELLAAGDAAAALERAEVARALWRGRPYGAVADQGWARAAVARLEEIHGRLRETHVGALLGTGAVDRALVELETALEEEPLRERLWLHRMVAYRAAGRRSDALAAYTAARAVLVDELGIEPGAQLRGLHRDLLREDPLAEPKPDARPEPAV
ncbi:MAG TPA: BTAD domain-containing putative transcriptional regulator, partial [Trebonia sp.]